MPKNSVAPISLMVSIKTRLVPTAIAGRANGIATRKNT